VSLNAKEMAKGRRESAGALYPLIKIMKIAAIRESLHEPWNVDIANILTIVGSHEMTTASVTRDLCDTCLDSDAPYFQPGYIIIILTN
jgi:hypothetical protein